MEEEQKEMPQNTNKKKSMDDILSVIKQFVGYFEEVDRFQMSSQNKFDEE